MKESVNEDAIITEQKLSRKQVGALDNMNDWLPEDGLERYLEILNQERVPAMVTFLKKNADMKVLNRYGLKDNDLETLANVLMNESTYIVESKAPNANKAIKDLKRKGSEINWLDDANNDTKKIWKKAGVNPEDENTVILYSYVSHQWDEVKKILNQHNVDFKELEDPNSAGESFIVFVKESINELRTSPVSGTKAGFTTSLEDRKYELKKDAKGATIGSFSNVTLPKGTIIYNLPGGVFADHFSLKNKYASRSSQGPQYFDKPTFKGIMIKQTPALLSYIEKNSKVLESVNEGISVFDERHFGKKGIIIMIDDNGKKVSAIFKDKKNADKFNRNNPSDIKKLLQLANKTKYPKAIDESVITEAARIPSNIEKFAKERGVLRDVKQLARWAEKAGLGIRGGTAIGKGYDTLVLDLTYQGAEIYFDTYTGKIKVNRQPVDSWKTFSKAVNESSEAIKKDIMDHWFELYGEKFINEYPAVAKILKQRKNIDARELARIWDATYGENFKEKYPAMWDKLS